MQSESIKYRFFFPYYIFFDRFFFKSPDCIKPHTPGFSLDINWVHGHKNMLLQSLRSEELYVAYVNFIIASFIYIYIYTVSSSPSTAHIPKINK